MSSNKFEGVQSTAFWVAHFRGKETKRADALFKDPFAESLAGDLGRNFAESIPLVSRYTEWSVVSRTVIIDRLILKLISEGFDALVNLGAGLDTRPYRLDLPQTFQWIEADHPSMIEYKSQILGNEQPKCKLHRVAVDLADSQKRRDFLASAAPDAKRVLILTEGVIPYLTEDQVKELAKDLIGQKRFTAWITEFFEPRVYRYLKQASQTAALQKSPMRFFPPDWLGFFARAGWGSKEIRYAGEVAVEFKRTPPMPWFAKLILPLLPRKMREAPMKMSGYMVLGRIV